MDIEVFIEGVTDVDVTKKIRRSLQDEPQDESSDESEEPGE